MLEQELKEIWSASSKTAEISIKANRLIEELNHRVHTLQKKISARDNREIFASIIGIFIFGYFLYEIPFLICKFASILSMIWFVYIIFKFRKSKKQHITTDFSRSMTEQLEL